MLLALLPLPALGASAIGAKDRPTRVLAGELVGWNTAALSGLIGAVWFRCKRLAGAAR
jgi:hypothetical protein